MPVLPAEPIRDDILEPVQDPVTKKDSKKVSRVWNVWFRTIRQGIDDVVASVAALVAITSTIVASASLTGQGGSLGPTGLLTPAAAGLYRVTFHWHITRAAGVSSSIEASIGWQEAGIAVSEGGPADTTNVDTAVQSRSILAKVDAATAITYSTVYASVGGPSMQYALSIVVEKIA